MVALSAAGPLGLAWAGIVENRRSIDGLSVLGEDRRIFAHMQGRIRVPNATVE